MLAKHSKPPFNLPFAELFPDKIIDANCTAVVPHIGEDVALYNQREADFEGSSIIISFSYVMLGGAR